jgi:hypothetical protein
MTVTSFTSFVLAFVALSVFPTCRSNSGSPFVDRRDPDAVLQAYFAAWNRNDTVSQKSFMTVSYSDTDWDEQPVDSLTVVSAKLLDEKSARLWSTGPPDVTRVYLVVFDYNPRGHGFSMQRGRYTWTYTLTWDAARASWLISNYGAG